MIPIGWKNRKNAGTSTEGSEEPQRWTKTCSEKRQNDLQISKSLSKDISNKNNNGFKKKKIQKIKLPDFAISSDPKNPIGTVITTPKDYLIRPR